MKAKRDLEAEMDELKALVEWLQRQVDELKRAKR